MLRFEKGNIVTGNYLVFCQAVNCNGVMGDELTKEIRKKYPVVYQKYKKRGIKRLGSIQAVPTGDGRICVNMFTKKGFFSDIDFGAFEQCLEYIRQILKSEVAFPYKIGCKFDGDWEIILDILKKFADSVPYDVLIVGEGEEENV